jgi:hypothetical protein
MQFEDVYLYLFIVITIYLGILTTHLLIKAIRNEEGRNYYLSIAFFGGFYMVSRILLNIELVYDSYTLYQYGTFFAIFGLFGFMFAVERYVFQKLKYIPTILILISALLVLIYPFHGSPESLNLITYYGLVASVSAIFIPFLYLYVGLKSSGPVRSRSLFLAFAIAVFFIGKGLNFTSLLAAFPILRIIVPITMLCGLLLFHIGIMR